MQTIVIGNSDEDADWIKNIQHDKVRNHMQLINGLADLGFDLSTNKALHKYFNSGMQGVMNQILELFENDENVRMHTLYWERKTMAVLVYNRAANGSKIPGCPTNPYTNEDCGWRVLQEDANYRMAAFKEVKPATLERWHKAIKLIDEWKEKSNG